MAHDTLGLIETTNLAAAMEASTAASANATVSSVTLIDAVFVVVKIEGDLASVQTAVEAGAHAAQQSGSLIGARIIPQRDARPVTAITPKKRSTAVAPTKRTPAATPKPRRAATPVTSGEPVTRAAAPSPVAPAPSVAPSVAAPHAASEPLPTLSIAELEGLSVSKLRQYARALPGLPIQGRQISMANKSQLLDAIKKIS